MPRTQARPPPAPNAHQKVPALVAAAFTTAQRTATSHSHALSLLRSAIKLSARDFITHYTHALNRVLLIYRRLPHVERLIHFIILTAATSPFTAPTLSYLLDLSNATAPAVRFRVMQILAGVLARLEDDVDLEEHNLFDRITHVVLSRINDRIARVRAAAAAAACRLQVDGNVCNDAVAAELARMCRADSSGAVRKAALKSLAMEHGNWAYAVGRTRDVRADIRRTAYEILGRGVRPDVFNVAERVGVLKEGLNDRDSGVRKVVREVLLVEGWLNGASDGNIVNLVGLLGGGEREEQVLNVLRVLFREKSCGVKAEDVNLDVNALEVEDVLVMRAMGDVLGEGALDPFFDSTLVYVDVLKYYKGCNVACKHLLKMCKCMDMEYEAGRKALERMLKVEFLLSEEVEEDIAEGAVRAMRCAMLEEEATLRILLEIVGVLVPSNHGEEEKQSQNSDDLGSNKENDEVERLTLAKQDGEKLNGSQGEECTGTDEQEWKDFRALTICREAFRICRNGQPRNSATSSLCASLLEHSVLSHMFSADDAMRYTAMECVGLFCLLDSSGVEARQKLPLFVRASKVDTPEIQELAVKIIVDCFMLFDFSDAQSKSGDDEPVIRASEGRRKSAPRRHSVQGSDVSSLVEECVSVLSQNITHSESRMRTIAVQGLARLMFLRRIVPAPTLLSRLLIVHHNPITEDDDELRQCLSVFFPAFAASSPTNRIRLEDTFKPTIDVILSAPATSPLSTIPESQVAQFIIHLTNRSIAPTRQDQCNDDLGRSADQIHERLAETVLLQLMDSMESYDVELSRMYGRILSNFRLVCDAENMGQLKMLLKLSQSAMRDCDDKRLVIVLKRFRERLASSLWKAEAAGIKATAEIEVEVRSAQDGDEDDGGSDEQSDGDEVVMSTAVSSSMQERGIHAQQRKLRSSRRKSIDECVDAGSGRIAVEQAVAEGISEDDNTSDEEIDDNTYQEGSTRGSTGQESRKLRAHRGQIRTAQSEGLDETIDEGGEEDQSINGDSIRSGDAGNQKPGLIESPKKNNSRVLRPRRRQPRTRRNQVSQECELERRRRKTSDVVCGGVSSEEVESEVSELSNEPNEGRWS